MFKFCTWFEEIELYLDPSSDLYTAFKYNYPNCYFQKFGFEHRKWIEENCLGNCVFWLGAKVPDYSLMSSGSIKSDTILRYCLPKRKQLIIFDHREDAMGFNLKSPALSTDLIEKDILTEFSNEISKY